MYSLLTPFVPPTCILLVDSDAERAVIERLCTSGVLPHGVAIQDIRSHRRNALATVRALRATRFDSALIVLGAFQSIDERIALLEAGAASSRFGNYI